MVTLCSEAEHHGGGEQACVSGMRKRRILEQGTPFEGIPPLMTYFLQLGPSSNCPFIY